MFICISVKMSTRQYRRYMQEAAPPPVEEDSDYEPLYAKSAPLKFAQVSLTFSHN